MSNATLTPTDTDSTRQLSESELNGIVNELGADRLCPNCNRLMAGEALWCQACGFYRSLGTIVKGREEQTRSAAEEAVYTRDWIQCAIGVSAMILLVTGISVAARLLTPAYSADRFWYSVAQIGVGVAMTLSAHVAAWIWGLLNTDELKLHDVLVNPIDVWRVTIEQLPKSWRRLSIGASGLLAVILGFTVVEGVTLAHLTGSRATPPKPKLLNKLVGQATAAGQAQTDDQPQPQTLEEAIEEFADQGEGFTEGAEVPPEDEVNAQAYNPWDEEAQAEQESETTREKVAKQAPARPEVAVKCVIVGYCVDEAGRINELLVAAMHRGQLTFAAIVDDGVKERLPLTLTGTLQQLVQKKPSIKCPSGERKVSWVRPTTTCRVNCHGIRTSGELVGPVFGGP